MSDYHSNELLGSTIKLNYLGRIECIYCGRKTKKSFSQGYCYPCMIKLARCDSCIVSPEKCHYDEGTCREPEWGEQHCMRPHYVYLANSSGVKVGITRGREYSQPLGRSGGDSGITHSCSRHPLPVRAGGGDVQTTCGRQNQLAGNA